MKNKPFVAEDLLKMKFPGQVKVAPGGHKVLFTQTEILEEENTYTSSIMLYDGKVTRPFTNKGGQKKSKDKDPQWSPDGNYVAFISDRSGTNQVWLVPTSGGEAVKLTDMAKGVSNMVWSANGASLVFVAKEDKKLPELRKGATARRITKLKYKFNGVGYYDNLYSQLWRVDLDGKVSRLTEGDFDCSNPAPSPCGKYLAFVSNRNTDELKLLNDIWLLDLESQELRNLTMSQGVSYSPLWTPEGALLYTGHIKGIYPGAYPELREIDLDTKESRNLMPSFSHFLGNTVGADARMDNGNTGPVVSADGKRVFFVATVGGSSYLYVLKLETGEVEKVYGEGQMCLTSFDVCGESLVMNISTPATVGDLWLGHTTGQCTQVTRLNADLFEDKYVGWPETMHFTHADGTTLEGWVIKPYGFMEGQNYPLVMEIHGGPHATYGNTFFHEFQMLAGRGMGVFYTNPRGSLGYGEDFARAVVGDWCGVDARDLQFMAEEAAELSWVDKNRIGVTGGSQGGYFTNWLIGHTDMFAAAVTQRSMSNLYTKYGVADNGWKGDRYGMGGKDLWEDEDFIMERSPIRYARNVKTPTLVIHSDQDYRCPLEQGEQWYVALKRLGVEAEMLLFHGENHELSRNGKPANRIVRLEAIMEWFERYL